MPTPAQTLLIDKLQRLPTQLEHLTAAMTDAELTGHFMIGEWSVAQNVHHLADSHMNSYIRCKLIATEQQPTLKPYDQDAWAALPDAGNQDVATSLAILRGLHARWVSFFTELDETGSLRTGYHPEAGVVTLDDQLQLYAHHGAAHIDQIRRTIAALPKDAYHQDGTARPDRPRMGTPEPACTVLHPHPVGGTHCERLVTQTAYWSHFSLGTVAGGAPPAR
ncbi:MAG: DinB family protein [Anaerolineales bacterium]|nr:DinB family protein [Anaerolineales bacterium]